MGSLHVIPDLSSGRFASSHPSTLSFQVRTDAGSQPAVAPAAPETARRRRVKPVAVSKPSGRVRIYRAQTRFTSRGKRRKYESFTIIWRDAHGRQRERRATLEDARARADEIDRNLVNGNTAMNGFGQDARASYLRCLELAAPLKLPPELIIAKYAELLQLLEGEDPEAAAKFFLQNRPKDFRLCSLPDLVTQFLSAKDGQISKDYYGHLSKQLDLFAAHFAGQDKETAPPLHLLSSADLNAWLRGLKSKGQSLSPRAKHNYRSAVDTLVRWAQANGYLPRTWTEMEHVEDPGTRIGKVKIWSPSDFLKLLVARQEAEQLGRAKQKSLIPFLVLQAFAGIRHEELARRDQERKERLDWRDIHLKGRWICIKAEVSKTGITRTIPITANLAAWLAPHAKSSGPVCELDNVSSALTRTKKAARLPAGKNASRNILRHSWVSYRLVRVKHIGTVAEEAGNSPGIIRKHYRQVLPPKFEEAHCAPDTDQENAPESAKEAWPLEPDANRWFSIMPDVADVEPLFAWAHQGK